MMNQVGQCWQKLRKKKVELFSWHTVGDPSFMSHYKSHGTGRSVSKTNLSISKVVLNAKDYRLLFIFIVRAIHSGD